MNEKFIGPDFFHDTPLRPIGIETEYTIPIDQPPRLSHVSTLNPLKLHGTPNLDEVWLTNGDMIYLDTPESKTVRLRTTPDDILEYVTAECMEPATVAAHEKIGETIVELAARQMLYNAGIPFDFPAYKRTACDKITSPLGKLLLPPTSTGHHENYSTPLVMDPLQRSQFLSYAIGRNIWAGAGIVTSQGYGLWQKAGGISFDPCNQGINAYRTHGEKMPLLQKSQRLELRMGDASMSPWVTEHKLAVTSLVLRLIEQGEFPSDYTVCDGECQAIIARNASLRPTGHSGVTGIDMTPLQHHRAILQAAYEFGSKRDVPSFEIKAVEEVLQVLDHIERFARDDAELKALAPILDWAAKLQFIQRVLGRSSVCVEDYTSSNLDMVRLDLIWEAVAPNSPSVKHFAKTGNVVDPLLLKQAYAAPTNTRSGKRVAKVLDLQSKGHTIDAITWDGIIYDRGTKTVQLPSVYSAI